MWAIPQMRDRMRADPTGQLVLNERPRVTVSQRVRSSLGPTRSMQLRTCLLAAWHPCIELQSPPPPPTHTNKHLRECCARGKRVASLCPVMHAKGQPAKRGE